MSASISELVQSGVNGKTAIVLAATGANTLTAAGTSSQANALLLAAKINIVTTAAANSGVRLPPTISAQGVPEHWVVVRNDGANAITVYPASGEKINNGSADAGVSLTTATGRILVTNGDGNWTGL